MKFHTSKQFEWDIEECIPHFYQVTTSCPANSSSSSLDPSTCQQGSTSQGSCPTVTMITVMACDVEEVCRKVKKQFKNVVIDKIIKFDKPALTRDQKSKIDPTCSTDVTPTPDTCVSCCDLLPSSSLSSSESSSESSSPSGLLRPSRVLIQPRIRHFEEVPRTILKTSEDQSVLQSNNFSYYGSGVINFSGGSAPIETTDAGELTQNITFTETLTDILIADIFVPTPTLPLPQTVQTISTPCCGNAPLTLCLEFKHTLNQIKPLADFMKVNNLILPGILAVGSSNTNFIKLNYATKQNQWRGNLHYSGQSTQNSFTESWDIGITFSCINTFWQFALTLANLQQGRRALSRLILYYLKSDVCPNNDSFGGFNFTLDTTLLESKPVTSQPIVLNDDAGFFSNLQLAFRILAQNQGSGSSQLPVDNTVPYDNALITTGGV